MIQSDLNIFANLNEGEIALIAAFAVLFILRFYYLLFFTARIAFHKKMKIPEGIAKPLSLIIPVRNEEENLRMNLPPLLSLEGIDFEVIVVDDFSQDDSFLVLGMLKKQFKRLKISALNQETSYSSKLAQNIALKAAVNDWVLIVPITIQNPKLTWISAFGNQLDDRKNAILGYSTIQPTKKIVNRIFRMESFFSYLKSTGFILNGFPYVYVAENLAFKKNEYFKLNGYGKLIKEHYANLELLINTFIRRKSTTILLTPEAVARKSVTVQWNDYFELLRKNIRVEKHLSFAKRVALTFDEFTRLLFLPVAVAAMAFLPGFWIPLLALLLVKAIAHLFIIKITQKRLNEPKIFLSSLTYDLFAPYFKFFYRWYFNRCNQKSKWRKMG